MDQPNGSRSRSSGAVRDGGAQRAPQIWIGLAALTVALTVIFQIQNAPRRILDQDELEHLNAAWLVSQGETLYGTVFENHPPLMTLLLQPIVRSTQHPETMIRSARYGAVVLALATLVVVGWMAMRLGGLAFAATAVVLLASHVFFLQKATEVRPDVPALFWLAVALAALVLPSAAHPRLRAFAAGALFCVAGLFTPKVVYAAAGATIGAAIAAAASADHGRFSAARRTLTWILLGAGSVAGVAALEMAREGILRGFLSDAVGVSLRMRIDDPSAFRLHFLLSTLRGNPATWALAAIGVACALRARSGLAPTPLLVLGASLAAGIAGLFAIDAPMRQYFLTFLIPVALFGALGAVRVLGYAARSSRGVAALVVAGLLAAVVAPPWIELRRDTATMADQLAVQTKVLALTEPNDRVFDCWTGLYLTRRPAYRYFYLNSDVQRLFDPSVLEAELLQALRNPEVRLVIADPDCEQLPHGVRHYVESAFAPVADWPFLLLRRDGAADRNR